MNNLFSQDGENLSPVDEKIFKNIDGFLTLEKADALYQKLAAKRQGKEVSSKNWLDDEIKLLIWAVLTYAYQKSISPANFSEKQWKDIAKILPGRDKIQCKTRWELCQRNSINKIPWSPEEENILREIIHEKGPKYWKEISQELKGRYRDMGRTAKQCRERWYNHLDPTIKRGDWSEDEDLLLLKKQLELGNKWSEISRMLPGRNENSVKNRWNSLAKKGRMQVKGIVPGEGDDDESEKKGEGSNADEPADGVEGSGESSAQLEDQRQQTEEDKKWILPMITEKEEKARQRSEDGNKRGNDDDDGGDDYEEDEEENKEGGTSRLKEKMRKKESEHKKNPVTSLVNDFAGISRASTMSLSGSTRSTGEYHNGPQSLYSMFGGNNRIDPHKRFEPEQDIKRVLMRNKELLEEGKQEDMMGTGNQVGRVTQIGLQAVKLLQECDLQSAIKGRRYPSVVIPNRLSPMSVNENLVILPAYVLLDNKSEFLRGGNDFLAQVGLPRGMAGLPGDMDRSGYGQGHPGFQNPQYAQNRMPIESGGHMIPQDMGEGGVETKYEDPNSPSLESPDKIEGKKLEMTPGQAFNRPMMGMNRSQTMGGPGNASNALPTFSQQHSSSGFMNTPMGRKEDAYYFPSPNMMSPYPNGMFSPLNSAEYSPSFINQSPFLRGMPTPNTNSNQRLKIQNRDIRVINQAQFPWLNSQPYGNGGAGGGGGNAGGGNSANI
mmetsp:Transcript_2067/g.2154  ORF Transcript_2067/g.2154 Transcript_2067/m.2154 type:complete len:718 (-) Transcript_2067:346-2499(-)|eukprot:CAMPEP_0115006198 /NCGR_PEP_ID=MMETSP0216-20121206/20347_1 /TAXON_ID=223996 /ORGANISM="Protocruzia adherens, Strain Boccale" /LENGTH=717 /DNA_ID=CAMNT_0002372715 /DNA_START=198 /DNA_END=2351 /DNA_ORIENTATION=-